MASPVGDDDEVHRRGARLGFDEQVAPLFSDAPGVGLVAAVRSLAADGDAHDLLVIAEHDLGDLAAAHRHIDHGARVKLYRPQAWVRCRAQAGR